MAYDLHVVRTANWFDAETNPITKEDIESLLLADPDLSWSEDFIDMRVDGVVTRFHLIEWKGNPIFWWYKNEIRFNSLDEKGQIKLIEIANTLNASVVGDDGEHYRLSSNKDGNVVVEIFQPILGSAGSKQEVAFSSKKPWYKLW